MTTDKEREAFMEAIKDKNWNNINDVFIGWQAAKQDGFGDLSTLKIFGLNVNQIAYLAGFYERATGIKPHQIFNPECAKQGE